MPGAGAVYLIDGIRERAPMSGGDSATAGLLAIRPTTDSVVQHAGALAAAYNEERLRLGNTQGMTPDDVRAFYEESLSKPHVYPFFLFADGDLVGDADLRNVWGDEAEMAILLERTHQRHGYGRRFAACLAAYAFEVLNVQRVYVAILPTNAASLGLFQSLGYRPDGRPRPWLDDGDVILALARPTGRDQAGGAATSAA